MAAAQTCRGAYTVPPSPPPPSRVRAKTFRRAAKYLMETWKEGGGFFFLFYRSSRHFCRAINTGIRGTKGPSLDLTACQIKKLYYLWKLGGWRARL